MTNATLDAGRPPLSGARGVIVADVAPLGDATQAVVNASSRLNDEAFAKNNVVVASTRRAPSPVDVPPASAHSTEHGSTLRAKLARSDEHGVYVEFVLHTLYGLCALRNVEFSQFVDAVLAASNSEQAVIDQSVGSDTSASGILSLLKTWSLDERGNLVTKHDEMKNQKSDQRLHAVVDCACAALGTTDAQRQEALVEVAAVMKKRGAAAQIHRPAHTYVWIARIGTQEFVYCGISVNPVSRLATHVYCLFAPDVGSDQLQMGHTLFRQADGWKPIDAPTKELVLLKAMRRDVITIASIDFDVSKAMWYFVQVFPGLLTVSELIRLVSATSHFNETDFTVLMKSFMHGPKSHEGALNSSTQSLPWSVTTKVRAIGTTEESHTCKWLRKMIGTDAALKKRFDAVVLAGDDIEKFAKAEFSAFGRESMNSKPPAIPVVAKASGKPITSDARRRGGEKVTGRNLATHSNIVTISVQKVASCEEILHIKYSCKDDQMPHRFNIQAHGAKAAVRAFYSHLAVAEFASSANYFDIQTHSGRESGKCAIMYPLMHRSTSGGEDTLNNMLACAVKRGEWTCTFEMTSNANAETKQKKGQRQFSMQMYY